MVERSRILDNTPLNICEVTENAVRYSICTLVTSDAEYFNMRHSFELAGFSGPCTEYLYVNNTTCNSLDAYESYRKFHNIARGKYIIYCHQDVLAIDAICILDERINELERLDHLWAIAGNAGASAIKSFYKYFVNGENKKEFIGNLPAMVSSLDEDFLVIKRETGVSTSVDLSGFHFYATDLCINADILGYRCYVIKYLVQHKSGGNMSDYFWASRDLFIRKYSKALRSRAIQTTCVKLVIVGNKFISSLANMSFVMFFIKVIAKTRKIGL